MEFQLLSELTHQFQDDKMSQQTKEGKQFESTQAMSDIFESFTKKIL